MTGALRKICGVLLIVAGVILMPVPILPGIPFVVAGAALLGRTDWLPRWVKFR